MKLGQFSEKVEKKIIYRNIFEQLAVGLDIQVIFEKWAFEKFGSNHKLGYRQNSFVENVKKEGVYFQKKSINYRDR